MERDRQTDRKTKRQRQRERENSNSKTFKRLREREEREKQRERERETQTDRQTDRDADRQRQRVHVAWSPVLLLYGHGVITDELGGGGSFSAILTVLAKKPMIQRASFRRSVGHEGPRAADAHVYCKPR